MTDLHPRHPKDPERNLPSTSGSRIRSATTAGTVGVWARRGHGDGKRRPPDLSDVHGAGAPGVGAGPASGNYSNQIWSIVMLPLAPCQKFRLRVPGEVRLTPLATSGMRMSW